MLRTLRLYSILRIRFPLLTLPALFLRFALRASCLRGLGTRFSVCVHSSPAPRTYIDYREENQSVQVIDCRPPTLFQLQDAPALAWRRGGLEGVLAFLARALYILFYSCCYHPNPKTPLCDPAVRSNSTAVFAHTEHSGATPRSLGS